jgi:hypothetical protein
MEGKVIRTALFIFALLIPFSLAASTLVEELSKLKEICDAQLLTEQECTKRRAEIWEKYNNPLNEVSWYCNYDGSELSIGSLHYQEGEFSEFSERTSASAAVKEILDAAGLSPNFVVRANGVPNAAAMVRGNTRFIEFNPSFIQQLKSASGTNWAVYSVLAHEIGHHLQGHTLSNTGSRPDIELEADEYSGFILASMGAKKQEALAAMNVFGSDTGSFTHPARSQRLIAISKGWEKGARESGGLSETEPTTGNDACYVADVLDMIDKGSRKSSIIEQCNGEIVSAEQCNIRKVIRLANDGLSQRNIERECNIPVVIADSPRSSTMPTNLTSNICQTPVMWCAIGQSGPVGTRCWCNTMFGPSNGQLIPSR